MKEQERTEEMTCDRCSDALDVAEICTFCQGEFCSKCLVEHSAGRDQTLGSAVRHTFWRYSMAHEVVTACNKAQAKKLEEPNRD